MEKPSKERFKKTLSTVITITAVVIVGLTIVQTFSKKKQNKARRPIFYANIGSITDKETTTKTESIVPYLTPGSDRKDQKLRPVFHANIGSITNEITSTKTESAILYLTPGSDKAVMKRRSDGAWLDSLENTVQLSYPFSGASKLKIWFISDIHVTNSDASGDNFRAAIVDIDRVEKPDYVFVVGDIGGIDTYLSLRSESRVSAENWYELAGNHELSARNPINADNFKNKLGYLDLSYTLKIDNMYFIFLGDEGMVETELTPSQRKWLEDQLKANSDKNIIVLCHYAIYNTTLKTSDAQTTAFVTPVADIQQILDTYQIDMWLHGHVHLDATDTSTVYK